MMNLNETKSESNMTKLSTRLPQQALGEKGKTKFKFRVRMEKVSVVQGCKML